MHRLSWTIDDTTTTTFAPSGFFAFPRPLRELLEARGVLLLPSAAFIIGRDGAKALSADTPLPPDHATLCWQPRVPPRPTPLDEREVTRDDGEAAPLPPLLLGTPDGLLHEIGREPLLVGRHLTCHVRLADERVSLFHCALAKVGSCVRVFDLGSTNGTHLDGIALREATLARRAWLRVGATTLTLTPRATACDAVTLPSQAMQVLMRVVAKVAPGSAAVHLHGESGVGKEVLARTLHAQSGRAGALVTLNAAGLSRALAGSELFGHVRGAFTGAEHDRQGAFERAHYGTLFLDEIAELSLDVQAELLRAVELGRVRPLGAALEVAVDVRIITATHRDLAARVRAGLFREDLYHRLAVMPLTIPPLRDRPDDLVALASDFLVRQRPERQLAAAAQRKLLRHGWPGNVRELFNVLRRACVMSDTIVIEAADLEIGESLAATSEAFDELMARRVLEVYGATGGSVAATAKQLGVRRTVVHGALKTQRRLEPGCRAMRATTRVDPSVCDS